MSRLPTPDEILAYIRENPDRSGKREIARAFNLKGQEKNELKQMLSQMMRDGVVERKRKRVRPAGELPPVLVLRVAEATRMAISGRNPLIGMGTAPRRECWCSAGATIRRLVPVTACLGG